MSEIKGTLSTDELIHIHPFQHAFPLTWLSTR
jgi:hypothetical protein